VEGYNRLLIEAPRVPEVAADIVFLDLVEIIYPRRLVAEYYQLAFIGANFAHRLDGFSARERKTYGQEDHTDAIRGSAYWSVRGGLFG
jgi:hypothetical protein